MKKPSLFLILFFLFIYGINYSHAQLIITPPVTGQALAQKLVGPGVTISNVTFTGVPEMAGLFKNLGGTNIGIDSGIILTNGRAKTIPGFYGVDGDGITSAGDIIVDNEWGLPGDVDLDAYTFKPTDDACVLEFDFVPLGDSIKFNYVFASEEDKTNNQLYSLQQYGQKVFSTSDFNRGWDGRINGVMQNTGSYVWMAEGIGYNGKVIKKEGNTILIR